MKIYGIIKSSGSYDEYSSYTYDKLFINKEEAEDEKRKIMNEIKERKERADRCDKCIIYEDCESLNKMTKEEFKIYCLEKLNLKCYKCSEKDDDIYCKNWTYDNEDHEPKIKEYELI